MNKQDFNRAEIQQMQSYMLALETKDELKRLVKLQGDEIKPRGFWLKILWHFVKPIIRLVIKHLMKVLDEKVEEILK